MKILLIFISLTLASCACPPVPEHYVASDEENIKTYHPLIREWIEEDPTLSDDEKALLKDGLDLREVRVATARKAIREHP